MGEIDNERKTIRDQDGHKEEAGCSFEGGLVFFFGLICGTFSAVLGKMAFETSSEGLDGESKLFEKPIMMLLLMFSGMVPAIIFWKIQQSTLPVHQRDVVTMSTMISLIVPCVCDLLCTLLLLVAQIYITASLWQMMRGTVIIVTAVLKKGVLNHRLRNHMWVGVCIITASMILVASTSFVQPASNDAQSNGRDPRVGIFLVVLGCLAQGVQYVFEEKVMDVDNAPPLVVIGMEGIWGTILTVVLVYPMAYIIPGKDNGSYENFFDSLAMISNSSTLTAIALCFVLFVTGYNCMAVYVTKYLSAIWHAILDNFRPITVWGLGLSIYYFIAPDSGFGEKWTAASWLQFCGLMVLFLGTAVYNGSIATCDGDYTTVDQDDSFPDMERTASFMKTQLAMASPSLTRSPLVYGFSRTNRTGSSPRQPTRSVPHYGSYHNEA